ncbi:MAG: hypothetical protein DKM50_02420 [Candidatus Margulisiibacteriota bacterium]|nr:MAG: hypothetical protein DKM50_02420 [Candidatus Margulisiibacteriota bacterium]HCY36572.1 hypothetical protein [Candidatus Margulisiibacteriota bacterium]
MERKKLIFLCIAVLGLLLFPGGGFCSFIDVPAKHWAAKDIYKLCDDGVIPLMMSSKFLPDKQVSRGDFFYIVGTLFGSSAGGIQVANLRKAQPEKNIAKSEAVKILKKITAFSKEPDIKGLLTRGDLVSLLRSSVHLQSQAVVKTNSISQVYFLDIPGDHWAYKDILYFINAGKVHLFFGPYFQPERPVIKKDFYQMMAVLSDIDQTDGSKALKIAVSNSGKRILKTKNGANSLSQPISTKEAIQYFVKIGLLTNTLGISDKPLVRGQLAALLGRIDASPNNVISALNDNEPILGDNDSQLPSVPQISTKGIVPENQGHPSPVSVIAKNRNSKFLLSREFIEERIREGKKKLEQEKKQRIIGFSLEYGMTGLREELVTSLNTEITKTYSYYGGLGIKNAFIPIDVNLSYGYDKNVVNNKKNLINLMGNCSYFQEVDGVGGLMLLFTRSYTKKYDGELFLVGNFYYGLMMFQSLVFPTRAFIKGAQIYNVENDKISTHPNLNVGIGFKQVISNYSFSYELKYGKQLDQALSQGNEFTLGAAFELLWGVKFEPLYTHTENRDGQTHELSSDIVFSLKKEIIDNASVYLEYEITNSYYNTKDLNEKKSKVQVSMSQSF